MVERTLVREEVHEAEIEPVHRHRPGDRLERVEPADLPEAPARLPRLLEQRERQPARSAQVPPPLLRHPLEERGLRQHRDAANLEELLQVAEGDGRVEIGTVDRRTGARVHDLEPIPVLCSQVSRLGNRRNGDRRQVGDELGVSAADRFHDHRIGRADQSAPGLLFPQLKVFCGNEFVADDPASDGTEAGGVAGVDELFGSGGIEMRHRFGAQNEDAFPLGRDRQGASNLAIYLDRPVGTGGDALTATDAGVIDHLKEQRLVPRHRDRIGGADSYARQAGDTKFGVDDEIQADPAVRGGRDLLQFDGRRGACQ